VEIDEAEGGSGGCFEDLAAIMPVFGRSLVVEPLIPTLVLGVGLVARHGSAVQRGALLPAVAGGGLMLGLAHAERQARDMTRWVSATARRGDAGWVLDGAKCVVPGGDQAGVLLVSARTSGAADDGDGISLFVVPRETAGLQRRDYKLYDGSGAADLVFADMRLPGDALLGEVGAGLQAVEFAYDRARAAVCAEAIGVMDRLREITLDYLRTRTQFGQPIGKFQALQHRMVDAHIELELARSMALLAVHAVADSNPARRVRSIAAAKARIGKAARTMGQTAVQLHGGIALTDDYTAGHYFKRLTMIERLFGDVAVSVKRFATAH
jgi:alkylation response protein AidB-like acyl-CoA dehydrogenase